jgi:hypothetical protein
MMKKKPLGGQDNPITYIPYTREHFIKFHNQPIKEKEK